MPTIQKKRTSRTNHHSICFTSSESPVTDVHYYIPEEDERNGFAGAKLIIAELQEQGLAGLWNSRR